MLGIQNVQALRNNVEKLQSWNFNKFLRKVVSALGGMIDQKLMILQLTGHANPRDLEIVFRSTAKEARAYEDAIEEDEESDAEHVLDLTGMEDTDEELE